MHEVRGLCSHSKTMALHEQLLICEILSPLHFCQGSTDTQLDVPQRPVCLARLLWVYGGWLPHKPTCACSVRNHNLQDLLHVAHTQVEGLPPVRLRGALLPTGARGLRAHIILAPASPGIAIGK